MQQTFGQMEAGAPPGGFRVIYADPPWSYRDPGQRGQTSQAPGGGEKSGAATHYDTLTIEQIAGLNVHGIAAVDSLCFMWVTGPQLDVGVDVLRSWGFRFVTTAFVWTKTGTTTTSAARVRELLRAEGVDRAGIGRVVDGLDGRLWPAFQIGQGAYTRANPEFVLLGRRGRGVPRVNAGVRSEVLAPAGRHSAKPDEVADRIVKLLGDVPRIELFARAHRPGWWTWGNEVDPDTAWHGAVRLRVPAPDEFAWQGAHRKILRVRNPK